MAKAFLEAYVYPQCIKEAIRDVLEENLRDYQDPEGPMVRCFVGLQ